jgi:multisite-specific tRNA:(cytosine-C5)-methyltransferase
LDPDMEELEVIRKFYNISPRFPRDRFMVRNATGTATKNIYYTTELAKSILQENEGKGMKFVHSGVKMFVKQDVPSPEVCPWRIQTDGLAILEAWVGPERIVKLTKRETLRKLLIEMFPRFHGDDWKNLGEIGEQVRDIRMGCCVLRVEPSDAEDGLR